MELRRESVNNTLTGNLNCRLAEWPGSGFFQRWKHQRCSSVGITINHDLRQLNPGHFTDNWTLHRSFQECNLGLWIPDASGNLGQTEGIGRLKRELLVASYRLID
jgi:hypothetical protein